MRNQEWTTFRARAIEAYNKIPEAGIKSVEEFSEVFDGVPTATQTDRWAIEKLKTEIDTDDIEKTLWSIKIQLINEFKKKYGEPFEGMAYYLALDAHGLPILFVEYTAKHSQSIVEKLFRRRGDIHFRQRLHLGFIYHERHKKLIVHPNHAYYLARYQKLQWWVIPFCFVIVATLVSLMAIVDGAKPIESVSMSFGAVFGLYMFIKIGYKNRMRKLDPEDDSSIEPMRLVNIGLHSQGIREWVKENVADFESIARRATTVYRGIEKAVNERPPAS